MTGTDPLAPGLPAPGLPHPDLPGLFASDVPAADATAAWCLRIAATLADVAGQTVRLAEGIAEDWPDNHGRAWAERATAVGRELIRDAHAAAELGAGIAREAAEAIGGGADLAGLRPAAVGRSGTRPGDHHAARSGDRGPGGGDAARLGGTEATKVDDQHGMRLAQLPDDTD